MPWWAARPMHMGWARPLLEPPGADRCHLCALSRGDAWCVTVMRKRNLKERTCFVKEGCVLPETWRLSSDAAGIEAVIPAGKRRVVVSVGL